MYFAKAPLRRVPDSRRLNKARRSAPARFDPLQVKRAPAPPPDAPTGPDRRRSKNRTPRLWPRRFGDSRGFGAAFPLPAPPAAARNGPALIIRPDPGPLRPARPACSAFPANRRSHRRSPVPGDGSPPCTPVFGGESHIPLHRFPARCSLSAGGRAWETPG